MSFPYKTSFWAEDPSPARAEALSSDTTADVVIVGAGFAGLSTAYYLKEAKPDLDVVLLEAEHVGFGPSGRNFGVVTPGMKNLTLVDALNPAEAAGMRFASQWTHSERDVLEKRIEAAGIECQYAFEPMLIEAFDAAELEGLGRFSQMLESQGVDHHMVSEEEMRSVHPYPVAGGLVRETWRLCQPWRLVRGIRGEVLAREVRLYEGTKVESIEPGSPVVVRTALGGSVTAGKLVMAVNAWMDSFPQTRKLMAPSHTHVIATEQLEDDVIAQLGFDRFKVVQGVGLVFYYGRLYDGRLLFGGGLNDGVPKRSTVDTAADQSDEDFTRLHTEMLRRFPMLKEANLEAAWGGPIDLTRTEMPIIKELPHAENVIVNVGYNGEGIIPGNASGKQVQGLVLGEKYTDVDAERVRRIYLEEDV